MRNQFVGGVPGAPFFPGARAAFTPARLFANGEAGAWYDPSDLSTLFQDSAGTTPVTAAGDPVGLMLDKSRGLVLGDELVANGSFDDGKGDWVYSGNPIITDVCSFDIGDSAGHIREATGETTAIGDIFEVSFEVLSITTGSVLMQFDNMPATPTSSVGVHTMLVRMIRDSLGAYVYVIGKNTDAVVDNISVRELSGNHASQATSNARPTYQVDTNGNGYLSFDGVDDAMQTAAIDFTGTDKMSVFAGLRKFNASGTSMVAETSADAAANNGAIALRAPSFDANSYYYASRGSTVRTATVAGFVAPLTSILTGLSDISGDNVALRVDGIQMSADTGDQGTGNYGNYALNIGARAGTSLFFNGHLYGVIIAGAASTETEVTKTENFLAKKSGVAL